MMMVKLMAGLLVAMTGPGAVDALAQDREQPAVAAQEIEKLRDAVEASPGDMEAHKAYLKAFKTADEVKSQYERWMKAHPAVAAIPHALGDKYGHYSPEARQHWLKAAELQPGNIEIWKTLALDASVRGNAQDERMYIGKALAAQPQNLGLQYEYAKLSARIDGAGKNAILELVKKHPQAPESLAALNGLFYDARDLHEKIGYAEQIRKAVAGGAAMEHPVVYEVTMTRLTDAYIQDGQYGKAIELSEAMIAQKAEARMNFEKKLPLARSLADVDARMKQGKYDEALRMLASIQTSQANLFDIGSRVELVKASVLDQTGSTREAYDALLAFQAKTPSPQVKSALEQYGRKLNKDAAQIRRELRAAVAANSKPAPAFVLDSYAGATVKLEELRGKVVLLSFWYPACGPCRAEMPHMEAGIKGIDKDKLVYLGVNGVRGQDAFVLPFMQKTGYSFTPLGGTEDMVKAYGVHGYPTNFIIDPQGNIAYSGFMINAANESMLDLMIRSLTD